MLDEATAAAEAMTLSKRSVKAKSDRSSIAGDCHPQTDRSHPDARRRRSG